MCTGLRGETRSPFKMSSEVLIEVSNPSSSSSLHARDLLHVDHIPETCPLNTKKAKQQRAAMRKTGIRKTQPHHCFTGFSSSSSSWLVSLVSLATPAKKTTSASLTSLILLLRPAGAWDLAPAPLTPTAASVGDGWTRPPVDCGEVAGNNPASRPRARAPVEAPTALPMIPFSFSDSGGCGAAGLLCSRKRILEGFFIVLPKLPPVPFPGAILL
mmetsp:Transcript_138811/g.276811  ORF Transcript_138811/g.276811 Transcript_138811/m.276811 type:complete len:214 (-) Transcript_138811:493-1134(-)